MNPTFPKMHVSLYVSNLAATVNFYNSFFNQPADKVKQAYAKYILEEPALIISFVENPERVASNFGHLGFQVESQEEMHKRLDQARNLGIVHKEEIGTACCYAVQDKFWVKDPDGTQWEVYYFHGDSEFNDPHYELGNSEACCMPQDAAEIEVLQKPKVALADLQNQNCQPGSGCC